MSSKMFFFLILIFFWTRLLKMMIMHINLSIIIMILKKKCILSKWHVFSRTGKLLNDFYIFPYIWSLFIAFGHQGIIYETCCNYLPVEFFLPILTYFVLWSILNQKISKILKYLYFEKLMCEGVNYTKIWVFGWKHTQ